MAKGIFNPFKAPDPPKKPFVSSTDPLHPLNTEYNAPTKGTIRLDGDSYVLQFNNIDLEELRDRLEALIKDIIRANHTDRLAYEGVSFHDYPDVPVLTDGQLRLKTPTGHLVIYAGEHGKEVDCFRRLAYALYNLPIKDILDKHNAKVYKRG